MCEAVENRDREAYRMNWTLLTVFPEKELIINVSGSWAELCRMKRLNHAVTEFRWLIFWEWNLQVLGFVMWQPTAPWIKLSPESLVHSGNEGQSLGTEMKRWKLKSGLLTQLQKARAMWLKICWNEHCNWRGEGRIPIWNSDLWSKYNEINWGCL